MSDSAPLPKLEGVHLSDRVDEGIGAGRFYGQMEGGRAAEVLLCPAQERGRFLTWARRFEQINHPTIPLALRVEEYAEPGFIAFDRVTLPSLAAWLRQRGRPLAALDAVALTLQIAAALRAAHRAQVYHGQLSPEAVRLAERAEGFFDVRLIGWGPPSLPFAEGVLEDIRGLGRLLYTALSAQPLPPAPPRVEDPLRHGLGGGDFDALLLELFDEQQALHGLHELALNAARRPHTFEHLDAVIEALLPHLQGGLAHNTHAAAWLAHNHNFLAEVNRRRARWAALRDQLAEEEAWQRSHQAQIAEAEAAQRQDLKSLQACQWLTTTLSRGLERPITLNLTAPSPAPLRALPGPDPFDAFIAPDLQPRVAVDYQAPFIEEARPPLMAPRPPSPPMAPPAPQPSPVEPIEDAQIAPLEPTAPPKGAQSLLFMGLGAAMILGVTLSITLVLHLYDEPHQAEPIAVGADAASTPSAPKPSASTPSAPPAPSAPEPAPPFVVDAAAPPVVDAAAPPAVDAAPPPAVDAAPPVVDAAVSFTAPSFSVPDFPSPLRFLRADDEAALAEPPPGMVGVPRGRVELGVSAAALTRLQALCAEHLKREDYLDEDITRLCHARRLLEGVGEGSVEVEPFFIDRHEVTQGDFLKCREAKACKRLKAHWDLPEHPATSMTHEMAVEYCAWRGKRLPTQEEWLRAARGEDQRLFPWGDVLPSDDQGHRANYGRRTVAGVEVALSQDGYKYVAPVGSFPQDKGAFELLDVAGNVREWTSTTNDKGVVVMGGDWRSPFHKLLLPRARVEPPDAAENTLGFRCLQPLKPADTP